MSTAIQKLDAVEIGKRLDAEIAAMPSDQLAEHVRDGIGGVYFSMAMIAPYIQELWRRFETLGAGESISGCRTKKEYCETVLNRTPRAVRYMLAGGNPVSKRNPGKQRETVSSSGEPAPVHNADAASGSNIQKLQKVQDLLEQASNLIREVKEIKTCAEYEMLVQIHSWSHGNTDAVGLVDEISELADTSRGQNHHYLIELLPKVLAESDSSVEIETKAGRLAIGGYIYPGIFPASFLTLLKRKHIPEDWILKKRTFIRKVKPCPRGKKTFRSIDEMREWGQKTGKATSDGSFVANKCRTCGQYHFDDRQDHARAMEKTAAHQSLEEVEHWAKEMFAKPQLLAVGDFFLHEGQLQQVLRFYPRRYRCTTQNWNSDLKRWDRYCGSEPHLRDIPPLTKEQVAADYPDALAALENAARKDAEIDRQIEADFADAEAPAEAQQEKTQAQQWGERLKAAVELSEDGTDVLNFLPNEDSFQKLLDEMAGEAISATWTPGELPDPEDIADEGTPPEPQTYTFKDGSTIALNWHERCASTGPKAPESLATAEASA